MVHKNVRDVLDMIKEEREQKAVEQYYAEQAIKKLDAETIVKSSDFLLSKPEEQFKHITVADAIRTIKTLNTITKDQYYFKIKPEGLKLFRQKNGRV